MTDFLHNSILAKLRVRCFSLALLLVGEARRRYAGAAVVRDAEVDECMHRKYRMRRQLSPPTPHPPTAPPPSPLPGWMQKYRMRRKLPSSGMDAYAPAIDEGLTAIRQGGRTSVVRGEPLTWALRVLEKK